MGDEATAQGLGHCLRFVHAALIGGGRVLLHCRIALSRSPSIAAAYLMWAARDEPLTVAEAVLRVREAWPRTAPSDVDLTMLVELGLELAPRDPSEAPPPTTGEEPMDVRAGARA